MAVDIINIATHGEIEDISSLSTEMVKLASEDPEILEQRNENGKSALDIASMLGRTQILQELVNGGANPNSSTANGYTSLHHAAAWGRLDCVKILVENGSDLQQKTIYDERARECAARYNHLDCVEFLDKAEARAGLKSLIQSFKDTIADPEKHMGRLSKDDRITGNKACDERNHWMENNKETSSLDEIKMTKQDLEAILQPIFAKLKEQS
eukprot:gene10942-19776_t